MEFKAWHSSAFIGPIQGYATPKKFFFGAPYASPIFHIVTDFKNYIQGVEFILTPVNLNSKDFHLKNTYTLSFQLYINEFGKSVKERSLIHLTNRGNGGQYGDRTPAVWIRDKKLQIRTAANGNWDFGYYSKVQLPEKQWIDVEISQTVSQDGV